MADRRPGPAKPSWKNSSSGGSSAKKQNGPGWKREAPEAKRSDRPTTRRGRLLRFGLAFAGCFGLIVWLILMLFQPRPAYVALIGSDYAETLAVPANVTGLNALRAIQSLAGRDTGLTFWGSRRLNVRKAICDLGSESGWKEALDLELGDLRKPFREKTLIVYLALHGGVDPSKEAYLLVGSGNREANRLPLKDVIAALKEIPKSKQVVLILDPAQIEASWTLGMVQNGFSNKLAELKGEIEAIPNLWVVSSCDSDQRSWPDRDGKMTVFGRCVQEALEGKGTGSNGRVNLANFFEYVKTEVASRVAQSWGAVQTPVLIAKGDAAKARDVQLNVVAKSDEKSDANSSAVDATLAASFDARWKQFEALENQIPTPATYAPHLWTRYRDTLVRYERLVRSGHPRRPERLEAMLDDLEKKMEAARYVDLKSSGRNTLAMPAATGRTSVPLKPTTQDSFAGLLKAAPGTFAKSWDKAIANENRSEEPWLKARLFDQSFQELARSPNEAIQSVDRIRTMAQELRPSPRPAEVHFASMLSRMMPDAGRNSADYPRLLTQVMNVRRQAERAAVGSTDSGYAYSEQVLPWIRAKLTEADQARRLSEDLIFSSEPDDWANSAALNASAREAYRRGEATAAEVRAAYMARDRAFANLPYLSRYVVRRLSVVEPAKTNDLELVSFAESLWGKVHELAESLDGNPDSPTSFKKLTTDIDAGLVKLDDVLGSDLGKIEGTSLPPDWDLNDALDVPIVRKGSRQALQPPRRTGSTSPKQVDIDLRNQKARFEARIAMAALGQAWFDRSTGGDPGAKAEGDLVTFEAVNDRLDDTTGSPEKDAPKRVEAFAWAGEQIGRRWRDLPARIDELSEGASNVDQVKGRKDVRNAERLERVLDGAGNLARSPSVENRRRAVQELLVNQARRSWQDHWSSEEANLEPFYLTAGTAYLSDADLLFKGSKSVAEVGQTLKSPGKLVFDEAKSVALTSESALPLSYSVHAEPASSLPTGYAVVWVEPGPNLQVKPDYRDKEHRQVIEFGATPKPVIPSIGSPLIPRLEVRPTTLAKPERSSIAVRGFYRGQPIERKTEVGIYPVPEVSMIRTSPPDKGSVTVRADRGVIEKYGEGTGAIAIILDCSGSMVPSSKEIAGSRFEKAKQALKELLSVVPSGTRVSIWVYGARTSLVDGRVFTEADDTTEQLRKLTRWDKAQIGDVMQKVDTISPFWYTPLVESMRKAQADFAGIAEGSAKTLLVLTDGMDQPKLNLKFEDDIAHNPERLKIPEYLEKYFKGTGIRVNLVCFQLLDLERAAVESNFKVVNDFVPRGYISYPADLSGLIRSMKQSANQKMTYKVQIDGRALPGENLARPVSKAYDEDLWYSPALDSKVYEVAVEIDRILSQKFSLNDGDRLLIKLGELAGGGLGFRRGLASDDYPIPRMSPDDQGNGWRLAVGQSYGKPGGPLQMMASIERTKDLEADTLRQPRPKDVWLEVRPSKGLPAAGGLVWGDLYGYAAPTYAIDALTWPLSPAMAPSNPTVEAWWSSETDVTPARSLKRGKDFQDPFDGGANGLVGRAVEIDEGTVTIDSVTVDEKQTRLVIRLSYPIDKPVFVRLEGMTTSRQEHRFYKEAGKYTGIFSATNRDEILRSLSGLALISVERLKREAAVRNDHARLDLDAPPAPTEERPVPIFLDR